MPGGSRDSLFSAIVRGLYEGRYAPGQRLVEADLTAEYGVSRGPVREALSRLAAEGIVTLSPGKGAAIRKLTRREATDLLELLEALIGFAAARAAQRTAGNPDGAARLEAALRRLEDFDHASLSPDYARARDQFYRALLDLADNPELTRVTPAVHAHLLRVQFREQAARDDRVRYQDYGLITAAVLAGDADTARTAAARHFRRLIEAMEPPASGA